ncbi:hypothetical protein C8Q73DRAFT_670074 [Cubamyces lactineus]|nr:hypothetical protein C8Q73DRAFT_670074 [Cubamyces lactineus]
MVHGPLVTYARSHRLETSVRFHVPAVTATPFHHSALVVLVALEPNAYVHPYGSREGCCSRALRYPHPCPWTRRLRVRRRASGQAPQQLSPLGTIGRLFRSFMESTIEENVTWENEWVIRGT